MVREFTLNTIQQEKDKAKKVKKLEIPIDFVSQDSSQSVEKDSSSSKCKVMQNQSNSTVMVEYSYMDDIELIGSLQGPTEAKFASKQDASKATIEVMIKCPNPQTLVKSESQRSPQKLRQDIKQILEQIVQTISYPRTLLTFTISLVSCRDNCEANLVPACVNACICMLNRAGINQKVAPLAALTVQLNDSQPPLFTNFAPSGTLVELVIDPDFNVLSIETIQGFEPLSLLTQEQALP